MKNILFVGHLLLVLASLSWSTYASADAGAIDSVQRPTVYNQFDAADHLGDVVYLDFWASWCGPCVQSFPFMREMQSRYKQQGFKVIAINVDANSEDALAFLQAHAANFDVVLDPEGKLAQKYKIIGMPSSFIINRSGEISYSHKGFRTKDTGLIEQHILETLEKNYD